MEDDFEVNKIPEQKNLTNYAAIKEFPTGKQLKVVMDYTLRFDKGFVFFYHNTEMSTTVDDDFKKSGLKFHISLPQDEYQRARGWEIIKNILVEEAIFLFKIVHPKFLDKLNQDGEHGKDVTIYCEGMVKRELKDWNNLINKILQNLVQNKVPPGYKQLIFKKNEIENLLKTDFLKEETDNRSEVIVVEEEKESNKNSQLELSSLESLSNYKDMFEKICNGDERKDFVITGAKYITFRMERDKLFKSEQPLTNKQTNLKEEKKNAIESMAKIYVMFNKSFKILVENQNEPKEYVNNSKQEIENTEISVSRNNDILNNQNIQNQNNGWCCCTCNIL